MRTLLFYMFTLLAGSSFAQTITAEAETGVLTGVTVKTDRAGFSGSGYVSGFDAAGDKVSVTVNVSTAGNYLLKIRYAIESGFGAKTNDVYVNGNKITEQVFPESNVFAVIEIGSITLAQGNNTIEVRHNWGFFDVDSFIITPGSSGTSPKANAGFDQVVMDVNNDGTELVTVNGSGSTDDGTITTYQWKKTDGTILEANNVVLSQNLSVGNYEFILTVTDNDGLTSEDRVKVFVANPTNGNKNRLPLRNGTESVFVSGINLAWGDFANDLDNFNETFFTEVLDKIKNEGGNAMRWWLHTNGKNSPKFGADGKVTGIDVNEIVNMRRALDMAYERGIVISMCLWSFDMLQNQGQNQSHMKQLVENKTFTQTYIDKALIPILQEIGTHPAVMCWEVFNEGEGMTTEFGWANMKTQMKYVQQFVNLVAGAIHRHAPGALVSNSGWSFRAGTDIDGNTNYYRDDRLIAAGGDAMGTLDFYQIHYYPEHFGNEFSPFHRPASYWGLDKPIVIGEFPIDSIDGKAQPHLSTAEAYKRAYDFGYAGVMAWSYTDSNIGVFEDAIPGLNYIKENHPEALALTIDPDRNTPPFIVNEISPIRIVAGTTTVVDTLNLKTTFSDEEDGTNLTYAITDKGNILLAVPEITADNKLRLLLVEGAVGSSDIVIRASDSEGYSTWATVKVIVKASNGNLALFRNAVSSSNEDSDLDVDFVNDGDETTRWSSVYSNNQFVYVDLGEKKKFNHVRLLWEYAYGKSYTVDVSDDAVSWTTVFTELNGNGGEDDIFFDATEARYVRMNGAVRGTVYGFSLWEFEIYDETTTSVNEEESARVEIFPNPASSVVKLSLEEHLPGERIFIFNNMGHLVQDEDVLKKDIWINTASLKDGLYIIQVGAGKRSIRKKLVIVK